jgi:hypothetical protein
MRQSSFFFFNWITSCLFPVDKKYDLSISFYSFWLCYVLLSVDCCGTGLIFSVLVSYDFFPECLGGYISRSCRYCFVFLKSGRVLITQTPHLGNRSCPTRHLAPILKKKG